jgi:hypothetical protein
MNPDFVDLLRAFADCAALEALFSSDASELSHKLSERVAWLMSRGTDERTDLYRKVRNAYQVRSSFVHGDSSPRSFEKSVEASVFLDDLLRKIFATLDRDKTLGRLFGTTEAEKDRRLFLESLCLGGGLVAVGGDSPFET